jgi:hypothetical protein
MSFDFKEPFAADGSPAWREGSENPGGVGVKGIKLLVDSSTPVRIREGLMNGGRLSNRGGGVGGGSREKSSSKGKVRPGPGAGKHGMSGG